MKTLIKNAFIIDPINQLNGQYDLLLEGEQISEVAVKIEDQGYQLIELAGRILLPGLIDMHTHLREPGYEEKETIKSGGEAAAAGGFTTIACMPNTKPVADNPATVEYIKSKARDCVVKVLPIGSITKNLLGKELAEIGFLAEAGVKALSDDGYSVMNSEIMRRAMEYANSFGLPIISHCEDLNLNGNGVMNEGYYSTILGLKPIPPAAEEIMIARDILLAELTGARLHIAHLSTKRGLEMVCDARERGLQVTTEVTPHHLLLTDKAVKSYNPDTKVNPPLRCEQDVEALRTALQDGLIEAIASDHAPHTFEDKLGEYDYAAFGISGLETTLALIHNEFIQADLLDWNDLVRLMLINPANILGLTVEGIKAGAVADLTIFDQEKTWTVSKDKLKSKGKNTPFAGWELQGKVVMTIVNGKVVYTDLDDQGKIRY